MKAKMLDLVKLCNNRLEDCLDYSVMVQIDHLAHGTQEAKVNGLILDHVRECIVLKTKY